MTKGLFGRLTDILIRQLMRKAHSLRLMLHRLSIDNGVLELLNDLFVNGVALGPVSQIRLIYMD